MSAPFTVVIDGVPIQCETPEDALALVRLHGGSTPSRDRGPKQRPDNGQQPLLGSRWTDQRVEEFFKLIDGKPQRKMIDALLDYTDGRTDAQLMQLLGLDTGSGLGGVFAGLWKNAKKVGADPNELYVKKTIMIGDKRGYEYTLDDGFRQAASHRTGKG